MVFPLCRCESTTLYFKDENDELTRLLDKPDEAIASHYFLAAEKSVIYVRELDSRHELYQYDERGRPIWQTRIPHSLVKEYPAGPDDTYGFYYHPQAYVTHNKNYVVFSSFFDETLWLDTSDGAQEKLTADVRATIWDENEADLLGFVTSDYSRQRLYVRYLDRPAIENEIVWSQDRYPGRGDRLDAIAYRDKLVFALYNAASSGAIVYATSRDGGTLKWKRNLEFDVGTGRSKYKNEVFLSRFEDRLIVEGKESAINYLTVLDINSGDILHEDLKL